MQPPFSQLHSQPTSHPAERTCSQPFSHHAHVITATQTNHIHHAHMHKVAFKYLLHGSFLMKSQRSHAHVHMLDIRKSALTWAHCWFSGKAALPDASEALAMIDKQHALKSAQTGTILSFKTLTSFYQPKTQCLSEQLSTVAVLLLKVSTEMPHQETKTTQTKLGLLLTFTLVFHSFLSNTHTHTIGAHVLLFLHTFVHLKVFPCFNLHKARSLL